MRKESQELLISHTRKESQELLIGIEMTPIKHDKNDTMKRMLTDFTPTKRITMEFNAEHAN